MSEAKDIARGLTKKARALLLAVPDDAQIYQYDGKAMAALRRAKLIDEYWTWVSNVRPGIQRSDLGRAVAKELEELPHG